MTTISAVGLGVDTQIKFKKLNSKQQDERRRVTYGLAAAALLTTGITAALGMKYRPTQTGGPNPLWSNMPEITTNKLKTSASWGGIFVLTGSGATGLGLTIDKGINGKKRDPAEQKKRDIAMYVLWAVFGAGLLGGIAYKKEDAIKGVFDDPYATVRTALTKTNYTLEGGDTLKNAQVAGALNAIDKLKLTDNHPLTNAIGKIPEGANTNTIFSTINTQLKQLSLKGRAAAAAGVAAGYASAGLSKTAGLFYTGDSISKPRVGSAVLLLASIITLAVLKSQKKLKPAPKPGKPAPPPKVPPGEIVTYVMIGLSVLLFVGSLAKDYFDSRTPVADPQAPEVPEVPAPEPTAPVDLALAKQYAAIKANFNIPAGVGNSAAAIKIASLPPDNPVKQAYNNLPEGSTNYTPVKAALNTAMKTNPLPPGLGQRVRDIFRRPTV